MKTFLLLIALGVLFLFTGCSATIEYTNPIYGTVKTGFSK